MLQSKTRMRLSFAGEEGEDDGRGMQGMGNRMQSFGACYFMSMIGSEEEEEEEEEEDAGPLQGVRAGRQLALCLQTTSESSSKMHLLSVCC